MTLEGFQIEVLYPDEPDTFTREEYLRLTAQVPAALPAVKQARTHTIITNSTEWKAKRRCLGVNPDVFFPESGDSKGAEIARDVCRSCVVIEPCLDEVLLTPRVPGIIAATSEKERRKLRKQRGLVG